MPTDNFQRMIEGLSRPDAYPHPAAPVVHIETHISHVFLAGEFAYKIKKPVDLGFLDFTTLERRLFFCEEELRLNRRLAPGFYLGLARVNGTFARPRVGGKGGLLDYAVWMRRFPQDALLARQCLTMDLIDQLADLVAAFHTEAPVAQESSAFGTPDVILAPMLENLEQIRARPGPSSLLARLDRLETWIRERWRELTPLMEERRRQGHVRECHGDMHRGNIALLGGQFVIFDALEFNPRLRWIDTASEIAFLFMDLEQSGALELARGFLNRYLERTGDYGALQVLNLYESYRAMVRAKVLAIRIAQGDLGSSELAADHEAFAHYLALAESVTRSRRPALLITVGLSGCGKSHVSRQLRVLMPLIHLRSDIERKRLFGFTESEKLGALPEAGIYFPAATDWTYQRLLHLAEEILKAGYRVLVDATFLQRCRRAPFRDMARRLGIPYVILSFEAPLEVIQRRIRCREAAGVDASDANLRVLEIQCSMRDPLSRDELNSTLHLDTSVDRPLEKDVQERIEDIWQRTSATQGARLKGDLN